MQKPLSEEIKRQTLEMLEKCGGNKTEAARRLRIPLNTFRARHSAATLHSSVAELEPYIPDGQKLKGVSTFYDAKGEMRGQWVKTNADLERQLEIIQEAAAGFKADIPKAQPVPYSGTSIADLLSVYVLTDYHLGQMSWAAEAGEDWDTDKSAAFLVNWFARAIEAAPPSDVGVLCQLGDFFHFDGMDAVTPTSKHLLDTDTRYARLVGVAIIALRQIIGLMLKKHRKVHIIMAEGNHDLASSIWLRAMMADKYEKEKRITVDNTAMPYYVYEWGKTSLFFHHGHKKAMSEISKAFAGLFRDIWGRTEYSYAHLGHYHHVASKEDSLMIVEQHPTMAVKDAYAARGGYLSNRGAAVITYSRKHGEVSRINIRPEMVKA